MPYESEYSLCRKEKDTYESEYTGTHGGAARKRGCAGEGVFFFSRLHDKPIHHGVALNDLCQGCLQCSQTSGPFAAVFAGGRLQLVLRKRDTAHDAFPLPSEMRLQAARKRNYHVLRIYSATKANTTPIYSSIDVYTQRSSKRCAILGCCFNCASK